MLEVLGRTGDERIAVRTLFDREFTIANIEFVAPARVCGRPTNATRVSAAAPTVALRTGAPARITTPATTGTRISPADEFIDTMVSRSSAHGRAELGAALAMVGSAGRSGALDEAGFCFTAAILPLVTSGLPCSGSI
jgi:hypothetical protein